MTWKHAVSYQHVHDDFIFKLKYTSFSLAQVNSSLISGISFRIN